MQLVKVNVIEVLVHHLGPAFVVFLPSRRVHLLSSTHTFTIIVILATRVEVLVTGVGLMGRSLMVGSTHAKI